jgi:hypothetical protein
MHADDEEGEGEDEEEEKQPSLDQLRSLSRVFVPKKVLEYYQEVWRRVGIVLIGFQQSFKVQQGALKRCLLLV